MELLLLEDMGNHNGYDRVIYGVESMDNGIYSAIDLVMSLKNKIPVVSSITVNLWGDRDSLYGMESKYYYNSYDDFMSNQNDFLEIRVETISVSGQDDLSFIMAGINLDRKTIGFSSKPKNSNRIE